MHVPRLVPPNWLLHNKLDWIYHVGVTNSWTAQLIHPHCCFLHALTVVPQPFADVVVGSRAVPVVPHEGPGEARGGGREREGPPHLDAVLLAEAVVVRLPVIIAVLRPSGKPICKWGRKIQEDEQECRRMYLQKRTVLSNPRGTISDSPHNPSREFCNFHFSMLHVFNILVPPCFPPFPQLQLDPDTPELFR